MPVRPATFLRYRRIPSPWLSPISQRFPPSCAAFHASSSRADSSTQTHYETLSLSPSASPTEIKKQFFTLSKKYHPDHNRSDPDASTKFVQISEAYHVLSVPDKRAKYDRELAAAHSGGRGVPTGSHSSAQAGFAGSRSPSGLSRRRTTFRGPPPSFYKSGGYGKHGAKRTEHAHQGTEGHSTGETASEDSYGQYGGFGPGQTGQGHEVPHFNDHRHRRTHEHVNQHIHDKRRARQKSRVAEEIADSNIIFNFILVGGTVAFIMWTIKLLSGGEKKKGAKSKEDS